MATAEFWWCFWKFWFSGVDWLRLLWFCCVVAAAATVSAACFHLWRRMKRSWEGDRAVIEVTLIKVQLRFSKKRKTKSRWGNIDNQFKLLSLKNTELPNITGARLVCAVLRAMGTWGMEHEREMQRSWNSVSLYQLLSLQFHFLYCLPDVHEPHHRIGFRG